MLYTREGFIPDKAYSCTSYRNCADCNKNNSCRWNKSSKKCENNKSSLKKLC